MNIQDVKYTVEGLPLYPVNSNADAFYWGANMYALKASRDEIEGILKNNSTDFTPKEAHAFWYGYSDAKYFRGAVQ